MRNSRRIVVVVARSTLPLRSRRYQSTHVAAAVVLTILPRITDLQFVFCLLCVDNDNLRTEKFRHPLLSLMFLFIFLFLQCVVLLIFFIVVVVARSALDVILLA